MSFLYLEYSVYCIVLYVVELSIIFCSWFRIVLFLFDWVSFGFISFFSIWIIVFLYCIVYFSVMYRICIIFGFVWFLLDLISFGFY